jgi:predicted RNase H-like HicB family nuclease
MRNIKFTVHKEGEHYVSQCLNVHVSSFGDSMEDAVKNLMEAAELYFEDDHDGEYIAIEQAMIGDFSIHA